MKLINNSNTICYWTDIIDDKQVKCNNLAIYIHEYNRPYCAFHSEKANQINKKRILEATVWKTQKIIDYCAKQKNKIVKANDPYSRGSWNAYNDIRTKLENGDFNE